MEMNLQAHDQHQGGYGRFGVECKKQLQALGVVDYGDVGHGPTNMEDFNKEIDAPAKVTGEALWLSTPPAMRGRYAGQHTSLFTMWESTEMPAGFRENLHCADTVFVPSLQNQELFSRFHDDVRYIPLGVDPVAWHYRPRTTPSSDFNFLTAGYGPRKNCIEVARAFDKVFSGRPIGKGPVPRLYVRSRDDLDFPNVYSISSQLSTKEEIDLYAQAHCYVSGARGEGWGLMPSQAIAQGLPTILGDAHGHAAFAALGIPIDTAPISAARATFWGDGGEWWEPDFEQMCEAMRDVYSHFDEYAAVADISSKMFLDQFTWAKTAEQLIFQLPSLFEEGNQDAEWEPVAPHLYKIRVNRTCSYSVNGKVNLFEPGRDYWKIADLKRQIIQNGQLDLACWDPHEFGLSARDAEALTDANERCPTCHQRFNIDLTPQELVDAEIRGGA